MGWVAAGLFLLLSLLLFALNTRLAIQVRAARFCYISMSDFAAELIHEDDDARRKDWSEKLAHHRDLFRKAGVTPVLDTELRSSPQTRSKDSVAS